MYTGMLIGFPFFLHQMLLIDFPSVTTNAYSRRDIRNITSEKTSGQKSGSKGMITYTKIVQ